jgi:hypothetical protein
MLTSNISMSLAFLGSIVASKYLMTDVLVDSAQKRNKSIVQFPNTIDYKYIFINYVSWILILALFYCMGFFFYYIHAPEIHGFLSYNHHVFSVLFGSSGAIVGKDALYPIFFVGSVLAVMAMMLIETKPCDSFVVDIYTSVPFPSIGQGKKREEIPNIDNYDFTTRLLEIVDFVILLAIVYTIIMRSTHVMVV